MSTCATCVFCEESLCRINPPTIIAALDRPYAGGKVDARWPTVKDTDWCGEWEPHPPARHIDGPMREDGEALPRPAAAVWMPADGDQPVEYQLLLTDAVNGWVGCGAWVNRAWRVGAYPAAPTVGYVVTHWAYMPKPPQPSDSKSRT